MADDFYLRSLRNARMQLDAEEQRPLADLAAFRANNDQLAQCNATRDS